MATPTRILLTGATGFVGGSILAALRESHPEIQIKALVRRPEDALKLEGIYPTNFEPIIGSLEDLDLLTRVARTVDFAVHAAHDNIPAVRAIIHALASGAPRFITITGPRSLIDLSRPVIEQKTDRPWNDVDDAQAILRLSRDRIHVEFDQAVIRCGVEKDVGTLLVSPGQLFGQGRGHFHREGACAIYYDAVKRRGRAFVVDDGDSAWSWVSIRDLARAVVLLMERAMSSSSGQGNIGVNEEGYYFVQAGDLTLRKRAEAVAERLQLGDVESVSLEEAGVIHSFGPIMWAADVRFVAQRLTNLGWKPEEFDWKALMAEGGGERA